MGKRLDPKNDRLTLTIVESTQRENEFKENFLEIIRTNNH